MEPLPLKQQSVGVDRAVTVGELGFGLGRVREGGAAWFLQGKREQLLCTEQDESRAGVCNFGGERFTNIFYNGVLAL